MMLEARHEKPASVNDVSMTALAPAFITNSAEVGAGICAIAGSATVVASARAPMGALDQPLANPRLPRATTTYYSP